jgi:hypothetical protein
VSAQDAPCYLHHLVQCVRTGSEALTRLSFEDVNVVRAERGARCPLRAAAAAVDAGTDEGIADVKVGDGAFTELLDEVDAGRDSGVGETDSARADTQNGVAR